MNSRAKISFSPVAWAIGLLLTGLATQTLAADAIRIGQTPGSNFFHLPTYIAVDRGLFAEEGLDVTFVTRDDERQLVAAGIGGAIDFVPDAGGARVSIKGAPVRYIVGQAQVSPWVIVADPQKVKSVDDLRGRTLGFGAPDTAEYEETVSVLRRFFSLKEADDYKAVSMPDETSRIAALVDGKIEGALVSLNRVPKAGVEGLDVILKIGHYAPQLEGAYWVSATYLEKNPDTVRRFIRAIARATLYLATERGGSIDIIQKRLSLASLAEANVLWTAIHREFDPVIPAELLQQAFQDNLSRLRQQGLWPNDRPMPPVEQFLASDAMKTALREIGY